MDILEDLNNKDDIVIYKFADDGTVKISADTTNMCLQTLQVVLHSVQSWAFKWRMIINCDRNKTEIICFNTAENNRDLIPESFKLGDKSVQVVSKTKVLGVLIDEDLSFLPQSDMIYNILTSKWAIICNNCNRHWGFTQRVMCQLIKTLFLSTTLYASHVWMTPENMKQINQLYYKMMKSAVFNQVCGI